MLKKTLLALLTATFLTSNVASAQTAPDQSFEEAERELLQTADAIATRVSEIRGLPLTKEIKKGIKRREELRGVLIEKLAEEVSDAQIEAEGLVYKRLGLIPQDLDYKKVLLDVLSEQIAGFYDQKTKELYVMQGIPMDFQKPAMAHELFHAVQDQHFDILSLQEPFNSTENGDFALARSALLEGDATVVMLDYSLYEAGSLPQGDATSVIDIPFIAGTLKTMSFDDMAAMEQMMGTANAPADMQAGAAALAQAPAVFKELLMFPYFAGLRFVVASRIGRTWKDVDAIYANPPVSTEQILHPEKYFAGDQPEFLTFDVSSALSGYEKVYDTVMGEFQIRLWLKLTFDKGLYDDAAAGWDGDRLVAYRKGDHVVVAVVTAWDSVEDAKEFDNAIAVAVAHRYPQATRSDRQGKNGESHCWTLENGETVYAERWGDLTIYIEGANPGDAQPTSADIRQSLVDSLKRESFSDATKARAK
ncbi:MAG: hypothetical protein R3E66_19695 [bacterium]